VAPLASRNSIMFTYSKKYLSNTINPHRRFARYTLAFTLSVAVSSQAQVVSPIRANPNDGTVVPLQCLGCFASSSFLIKTNNPEIPERPIQLGDFSKNLNTSYEFSRQWKRDNYIGNYFFTINDAANRYMLTAQDSATIPLNYGPGSATVFGFFLKANSTYRQEYRPNGVCKGPIINVAHQFAYDADTNPLKLFDLITLRPNGIDKIDDRRQASQQVGLGSIISDSLLICFGDLLDADKYYQDVQASQVKEALEGFKQNASPEQIEKYVKAASQEYFKSAEGELVERTVRATIETLRKQGYKITPPPPTKH
jgi:hypothetical protein